MASRTLKVSLSVLLLTGAVLCGVVPQRAVARQAAEQDRPVFRGGANLVLVDAYPQRDGRIVEGLTAADFAILEDGKPQTTSNVEFVRVTGNEPETARRDPNTIAEMKEMAADPHNRVFVAFLDTLFATVEGSNRIRVPLVQTLNRVTGPEDLFGVMTPAMGPRDVTFARRMLSTEDQLTRYWAWGQRTNEVAADRTEVGLTACFHRRETRNGSVPWLVGRQTLDEVLIERRREDLVLRAFEGLVPYLASLREARSVVFAVTDGWPNLPPAMELVGEPAGDLRSKIPPTGRGRAEDGDFWGCTSELNRLAALDNRQRWRDLMAAAGRANVSFYPIAPNGLAAFDVGAASERPGEALGAAGNYRMMQTRVQTMVDLAENTDGIAIVNRNDTGAAMTRIIDDISAYYLLGYYSTNTRMDGKFRKIDVKLKQPGLTIHARRGYVAQPAVPTAAAPGIGRGTATAAPSPSLTGVTAALGTLTQLRPTTELFVTGTTVDRELTVTVELATSQSDTAAWRGGGAIELSVQEGSDAPRIEMATLDAGARATRVTLPVTGTAPVTIRARATAAGARLDSDQIVVAPAEVSVLRPALLYRAAVSPRAPLKPMADPQVRRTERLHVEWPLTQAADQRDVRLLDRRGQPLAIGPTLTEREVNGHPVIAADLAPAPLAEGDYVLEASVVFGGMTTRQWVAFRVVR